MSLKRGQVLHQVRKYLCREVSACFVLMIFVAMLEWPHAKMAADSRHIGGTIVVFEATLIFTEVEHFPLSTMRDDHLCSLRAAELQEFQAFHQSSQCLPVKLCQFDVVDMNSSDMKTFLKIVSYVPLISPFLSLFIRTYVYFNPLQILNTYIYNVHINLQWVHSFMLLL